MRSKTIIVVIISVLWVCLMASCASQKQRDLKKFTKIVERNPDFIKTEIDTVFVTDNLDTVSLSLFTDSLPFRQLLDSLYEIQEEKRYLATQNLHLENLVEARKLLYEKENRLVEKAMKGIYVETSGVAELLDGLLTITWKFDPNAKQQMTFGGTYKSKIIEITKTVKQLVPGEITNWQAIKKIWFIPAILLLVIALLVIFK